MLLVEIAVKYVMDNTWLNLFLPDLNGRIALRFDIDLHLWLWIRSLLLLAMTISLFGIDPLDNLVNIEIRGLSHCFDLGLEIFLVNIFMVIFWTLFRTYC